VRLTAQLGCCNRLYAIVIAYFTCQALSSAVSQMLNSILSTRIGDPPGELSARILWLECKCRAMRAQGLAGHWAYDLALHRNLLMILEAERAALAATECSSVSPDRQHARAA
jgi:hypothetical protein